MHIAIFANGLGTLQALLSTFYVFAKVLRFYLVISQRKYIKHDWCKLWGNVTYIFVTLFPLYILCILEKCYNEYNGMITITNECECSVLDYDEAYL